MQRKKSANPNPNAKVRLSSLEKEITTSLVNGFVSVGVALETIRGEGLFKATHKTFEEYYKDKFELTKPSAYRYIESARVYKLIEKGQPQFKYGLPLYESQIRPLTRVKDENQIGELWNEAFNLNEKRIPPANIVHRVVIDKTGVASSIEDDETDTDYEVADNGLIHLSQIKKRYSVILADPPWDYPFALSKSVKPKYPTLNLPELVDIGIQHIAKPDCTLFMWCTSPKLDEGIYLINQLGFKYTTEIAWIKEKPSNIGIWVKSAPEHLLIATKGTPGRPDFAKRAEGFVAAVPTGHSKKPNEFYKIVEDLTYGLSDRIELFAREITDNWDCWGDEVGYHQCPKPKTK